MKRLELVEGEIRMVEHLAWTTEAPTLNGWYWVRARPFSGDYTEVHCVFVSVDPELHFIFPVIGFECDHQIGPENTDYWYGPLVEPEFPK
jgi:hypothetical protein